MNAIPPADPDRTARHLAMLQRLSEIGMALACAVGERALAALTPPATPERAPETDPAPEPEPEPAPIRPGPGRADPALVFARLAGTVRQCIALEARLAAGPLPAPRGRAAPRPYDPRRDEVRRVVHLAAKADGIHPAALRREIEERLDAELDADPDGETEIEDITGAILEDLGLGRNLAKQPDEVLAILLRTAPREDEEEEADEDRDPDPHPPAAPPATWSRPAGPDPP